MSNIIKLYKGLDIKQADDGHWLMFDSNGQRAMLNLENMVEGKRIIASAILNWAVSTFDNKPRAGAIDFEALEKEYAGMSIPELAGRIRVLKEELDEKAAIKARAQKIYDHLTISIVPDRMDDENIQTMKVEGVGRLQTKADIRCACPAPNREELEKWLKDHNHGAMIGSSVNSSLLKAFVKEQMKQNGEWPEMLLKVEPFSKASVVKV